MNQSKVSCIQSQAAHRAAIFPARGVFLPIKELWRNWLTRKRVQQMKNFDDDTLYDIGVTFDELSWASKLPLTVNAAVALEDRAFRRRKNARKKGIIV